MATTAQGESKQAETTTKRQANKPNINTMQQKSNTTAKQKLYAAAALIKEPAKGFLAGAALSSIFAAAVLIF